MHIVKSVLRIFFALVFLVLVALTAKGFYLLTGGFRPDKIKDDTVFVKSEGLYQGILGISEKNFFDKKFKYLNKGCQTYVFESEDKNYVIKFIRYSRYRLPFWMPYISFCKAGKKYRKERKEHKETGFRNALRSYRIAYEQLRDESGTCYVHLCKTDNLKKRLLIVDKLGRKRYVDLDLVSFILQRKAERLEDVLFKLKKERDDEGIKKVSLSFLNLIKRMYEKNLTHKDYNCVKNSGYLDGEVIIVDLGSFFPEDMQDKEKFYYEMCKLSKRYRKWLIKNFAEILPYFDEQVKKVAYGEE